MFAPGTRPSLADLQALAGASFHLTHGSIPEEGSPPEWVELLVSGLSYDAIGLAPGVAAPVPPRRHAYGVDISTLDTAEAVTVHPGPHLNAGSTMVPVLRVMADLAAGLTALPGVLAVAWHPAACLSEPEMFRTGVARWLAGGPFPAFSLAALAETADGALESEGLRPFAGSEVRIEPELAHDRAQAGRVAVRVMHHLTETGRLREIQRIQAPDGSDLVLDPAPGGELVRVRRA